MEGTASGGGYETLRISQPGDRAFLHLSRPRSNTERCLRTLRKHSKLESGQRLAAPELPIDFPEEKQNREPPKTHIEHPEAATAVAEWHKGL